MAAVERAGDLRRHEDEWNHQPVGWLCTQRVSEAAVVCGKDIPLGPRQDGGRELEDRVLGRKEGSSYFVGHLRLWCNEY